MISILIGTIAGQERDGRYVVECGGVGYLVTTCKRDDLHKLAHGRGVTLYVRQVWSETAGPSLYGWLGELDRYFFDRLCKVEGMGPGRAAKVVDVFDLDGIKGAAEVLTPKKVALRIDGVGPALATKIVDAFRPLVVTV